MMYKNPNLSSSGEERINLISSTKTQVARATNSFWNIVKQGATFGAAGCACGGTTGCAVCWFGLKASVTTSLSLGAAPAATITGFVCCLSYQLKIMRQIIRELKQAREEVGIRAANHPNSTYGSTDQRGDIENPAMLASQGAGHSLCPPRSSPRMH